MKNRGEIPSHVAVIMDGNGRWAEGVGLPRVEGHRRGARATKEVIREAGRRGVRWLTLYAFSTENWGRPAPERNALFQLMRQSLQREVPILIKEGIAFRMVGDPTPLPLALQKTVASAEKATSKGKELNLSICINYSGQAEILRGVNRLIQGGKKVDAEELKEALDTQALPPVDLLLRTGGEMRLSNFLLWDAAYAELFFSPTLWPDFSAGEFGAIVDQFQERTRRYGQV
ncbi:di-trans,poly-cis-decaprenylcistransferase [bacterium]|nr:di-trans,poly-cis-decaprenylcistransferase [bacterium]